MPSREGFLKAFGALYLPRDGPGPTRVIWTTLRAARFLALDLAADLEYVRRARLQHLGQPTVS